MLSLPSAWAHETGLSTETRIPKLWDSAFPVISGTGADVIVPSHPNAGQRDQYQSQGAAQAPSAIQIGHKDQGMGRGREEGSRAETSGTPGAPSRHRLSQLISQ